MKTETKPKRIWTPNTHLHHHLIGLAGMAILAVFIFWVFGNVLGKSLYQEDKNPVVVTQPDRSLLLAQKYPDEDKGKVLSAQVTSDPHITAVPGQTIQQRYVLRDGDVQPIFIFNSQYPKFIGETNIQNTVAYLDIYGSNHITGNTKIDSNGNWEWQANVPIQPGTYIFNVRALDSDTREELAKDSMLFEVVLGKSEIPQTVDLNNVPQIDNNGTLFDIRVGIPSSSKTIKPGDDLPADIKLVNIGSPTQAVDVEVQYTIRNEDDEVISEQSETVAVKKELTYSKKFFTSDSLPDGNYKLTVAIPSKDLIATASDNFKINKTPAVELSTESKPKLPINNAIIQIVGAVLFLGILIGYMEYTRVSSLSQRVKKLSEQELLTKS